MSTMDADATFNKTAARNGSFANIGAESVAGCSGTVGTRDVTRYVLCLLHGTKSLHLL